MTLTESSIYTNLRKLRVALYRAQFGMMKTNRVVYGTPLMQSSANAMKYFVLAFECKTTRVQHLEECIGWFAVLRVDLEFCIEQNIIHDADAARRADGQFDVQRQGGFPSIHFEKDRERTAMHSGVDP